MKQAIIDIGSNSIRLTLYETEGQNFKILFREKIMAGLAGYVEDGKLSAEGIECRERRDSLTVSDLSQDNLPVFFGDADLVTHRKRQGPHYRSGDYDSAAVADFQYCSVRCHAVKL